MIETFAEQVVRHWRDADRRVVPSALRDALDTLTEACRQKQATNPTRKCYQEPSVQEATMARIFACVVNGLETTKAIALETGFHQNTVNVALTALLEKGAVRRERMPSKGKGRPGFRYHAL